MTESQHHTGGSGEPVHSITSAAAGRSGDLDARVNRYFISMGIRTLCFILAIFVSGPMRWVFITGAILLPYVAVIMANQPSTRRGSGPVRPAAPAPGPITSDQLGTLPRQGAGTSGDSSRGDRPNS